MEQLRIITDYVATVKEEMQEYYSTSYAEGHKYEQREKNYSHCLKIGLIQRTSQEIKTVALIRAFLVESKFLIFATL